MQGGGASAGQWPAKRCVHPTGRPLMLLALLLVALSNGVGLPSAKDGLADARGAFLRGDNDAALAALGKRKDPAARALRAQTLAAAGDLAGALSASEGLDVDHPLERLLAPQRVTWLRALGRHKEAARAADALVQRALPGAHYMAADVAYAQRGCDAVDNQRAALAAEPSDARRHSARRVLLRCLTSPVPRLSVALDMLEDPAPVDTILAREALRELAAQPTVVATLPRVLVVRVVRRMLMERLGRDAVAVAAARSGPLEPDAVSQGLLEAQLLLAAGKPEDRRALVEALHARADTRRNIDVWKAYVALFHQDHPQSAKAQLELAEAFRGFPAEWEARHLAGFHLQEAGDRAAAVEQWSKVAQHGGPRQKDAQWFVVRALWQAGDHARGAEQCRALAAAAQANTERQSHLEYWAARMEADGGRPEVAGEAWKALCHKLPNRLYGRMACERVAAPPPSAQPVVPLGEPHALATRLATDPGLDAAWQKRLAHVAWLAAAAAHPAARAELAAAWPPPAGLGGELLLKLGQLALLLGDANAAVVLAERHRSRVDGLDSGAWLALGYPRVAEVAAGARAEQVDEDLALAVARTESFFAPQVRSPAGAGGLMQLMPATAAQLHRDTDPPLQDGTLFDADINARLGSRYLRLLGLDFGGRPELMAAAYNSGPTNARRFYQRGAALPLDAFVETVPFRETRGYIRRVLEAQLTYAALDGRARHPGAASAVEASLQQTVDF